MIDDGAINAVKSHLVKEFSRILKRRWSRMRISHTNIGVNYRYTRGEAERGHKGYLVSGIEKYSEHIPFS